MSKFIYLAGLIDGEGTVGIAHDSSRKYRAPYLSVSSTTYEIMEWLKSNFGGSIVIQKVYNPEHKQSWSWRLRNKDQLFSLLSQIEPYMLEPEKKRRIHMLVEEYESVTVRNGKYSEEQTIAKLEFEQRFLNGGGGGNRTRVLH